MLRINLLPAYVAQRRLTARLIIIFTVLVICAVVGPMAWYVTLPPQLNDWTTKATAAVADKAVLDGLDADATATTAKIGPIQAKLNFYDAAQQYNLQFPKLYRTVAAYTAPQVTLSSMNISATTLTMTAYCPSIAVLNKYLAVMYQEPDIAKVSVTGFPGYNEASTVATHTVSVPAGAVVKLPGIGAIAGLDVYKGRVVAVHTAAQGANGGAGAGATLGAGAAGLFNPYSDGFDFTVTATLKQALTPPTFAAPGAPGGAAGGPGGEAAGARPGGAGPGGGAAPAGGASAND